MEQNSNHHQSSLKKHSYVITMVISMLLGVGLVLGTPLFNSFLPDTQKYHGVPVVLPITPHVETAGSSL